MSLTTVRKHKIHAGFEQFYPGVGLGSADQNNVALFEIVGTSITRITDFQVAVRSDCYPIERDEATVE
jgi:hypothetical protein